MKRIKRIFLRLALTEEQRKIFWQAVIFSRHTYKRRGRIERTVAVQEVINQTKDIFGIEDKTYTEEEVLKLVDKVQKRAILKTLIFVDNELFTCCGCKNENNDEAEFDDKGEEVNTEEGVSDDVQQENDPVSDAKRAYVKDDGVIYEDGDTNTDIQ